MGKCGRQRGKKENESEKVIVNPKKTAKKN